MGLMLFDSICAQCYDSVFKSTLLRQSHTTCHNHWRGSIPQKKNHAITKKPSCALKNRLRHRNYQPVCKIVFKVFRNDSFDIHRMCTGGYMKMVEEVFLPDSNRQQDRAPCAKTIVSGFPWFLFIPPPQIING